MNSHIHSLQLRLIAPSVASLSGDNPDHEHSMAA